MYRSGGLGGFLRRAGIPSSFTGEILPKRRDGSDDVYYSDRKEANMAARGCFLYSKQASIMNGAA